MNLSGSDGCDNGGIIDIGCGTGAKYPLLRRRGRYLGLDPDLTALRCSRRLYPSAILFAAGAASLPLVDCCAWEVHLYDVLEHIEDRQGALAEAARVLRPGGRLIVESPHWLSEERMQILLPSYREEVGHRAILREEDVVCLAGPSFRLVRTRRKHGMQNFLMSYYVRHGGHLSGQGGVFTNDNRFLDLLTNLCSEDLFFLRIFGRIPLWIFAPIWILTLPVGWLLSQIYPKTIRYQFERVRDGP